MRDPGLYGPEDSVVQQKLGHVVELVYTYVSEAYAARLGSSSLPVPTVIGIFDSGSGGLTVLKRIREALPSADVIYLGDIARAPYGPRSRAELSRFTMEALLFLHARGATSIVSACNSVSASLALSLFDTFDTEPKRMIEMVGPTVSAFKGSEARLLLVATTATIDSGIYQNAFTMIGKECAFQAIDGLAAGVEFGEPEASLETMIREALRPHMGLFDIVILACTHYPLVAHLFARVAPDAAVFDPALAVAERAERRFWPQEVGDGRLRFAITKDSPLFRERVAGLFGPSEIDVVSL